MAEAEHIVVVDDDPRLRKRLAAYLEGEGFRVTAADGGEALRRVMAKSPGDQASGDREGDRAVDLVILDLVMPGEDGLSLTRFLRATTDVGIIILTGKGEPVDRVVGLEVGADDYVAKPFELRELLARIRSVLRRLNTAPGAQSPVDAPSVNAPSGEALAGEAVWFAGWRLDPSCRELVSPGGETVQLTAAEFKLLAVLVDNPNRPLDRDRLLDAVGGRDWQPFDRSIDLHISHLRRKLEDDPRRPALIKTVRGEGYMLAAPVTRAGGADST